MTVIEFIKQIPIFGGLDEEELAKVAGYLRQRSYPAGEIIVREGEQAKELFIVHRGQVEIYKERARESAAARIALLGEGECFGEMSLIDIMPRSASVRAVSDTEAMSLSYSDFHALCVWRMETYTMLVMNIAREISRRLRLADSILAEVDTGPRR